MNYASSLENTFTGKHYKISRYAYGKDYHNVIKPKLLDVVNFLKQKDSSIKAKAFVDSGPMMEKTWAEKAGTYTEKKALRNRVQKQTRFCFSLFNIEVFIPVMVMVLYAVMLNIFKRAISSQTSCARNPDSVYQKQHPCRLSLSLHRRNVIRTYYAAEAYQLFFVVDCYLPPAFYVKISVGQHINNLR